MSDAAARQPAFYLTEAQLRAEAARCEYCESKPCKEACPCDCSPADFIKAVGVGGPSDYRRAAALIMGKNPLGGVCGLVCPDTHCMAACARQGFDRPVDIPRLQATIVERAKRLEVMPRFRAVPHNGQAVAIVGGGPAGLAAAACLVQQGYGVTIYDQADALGGTCRAIPPFRLDRAALQSDLDWLIGLGKIQLQLGRRIEDPRDLLDEGHDAVLVAAGLFSPIALGVAGEDAALAALPYLFDPDNWPMAGRRVAVVGGGATAFDCAMTARAQGAAKVELIALETVGEMPLSANERADLLRSGIDVSGRTRVVELHPAGSAIAGITTVKTQLRDAGRGFALDNIEDVEGTRTQRRDIDRVIIAIGYRPDLGDRIEAPRLFYAGDCVEGPTTVVEAAAAGKHAAEQIAAYLDDAQGDERPTARSSLGAVKSRARIAGYDRLPVPLETSFFGRPIASPLLLSAAPPTDGLAQMRLAYAAGWAGGVLKTAFDGLPIHIPSEYMFTFGRDTYANCDNVSGHSLDRVCREVEQLVRDYPEHLTLASTGGPVSGDDARDARVWQRNTSKLEAAGAMGIEYSLSCPQGGDGTEGDIVSQNAELTAKIVGWVLETADPSVPKLFKLTGAVTSIERIAAAIKQAFDHHPGALAGVTLANTFPTLAFRPGRKASWEEGVIVGMSGRGALHISYLTLAKVAGVGLVVSGNGGPMDYKGCADFLALGASTVQLCTVVMRDGYGVVDELHSGLSHLMAARGLRSVDQLVGIALPDPVTDFMALPAEKKISRADPTLCQRCGNCLRCPYLAIGTDEQGYPVTDPARCIGCSICSRKCFAGAIQMLQRTPEEAAKLAED